MRMSQIKNLKYPSSSKQLILISSMALIIMLLGCSKSWISANSINKFERVGDTLQKSDPSKIVISEIDLNAPYETLGDLSVTAHQSWILANAPSRAEINQALAEEAAKLGADAVILVRYGEIGVSFFSWASLEGKGRAIKFQK
jgi:hypothetical protein